MTWPEAPRTRLWQALDEEGNYKVSPYAYTLQGSCQLPSMPSRVRNLPEVKVEHTGWPSNFFSYDYVNTTPLEVGEWGDLGDLQPLAVTHAL